MGCCITQALLAAATASSSRKSSIRKDTLEDQHDDLLKNGSSRCKTNLQCSYGHYQTTFNPTCARSAGFYMTED
ncbi:hypothetical protein AAHA92_20810 [Salvia divinorum]|uniref:Secreted protein n=1 Tax=Salvia divinorum TaxID=28513 RepID=A0ABD1GL56_SALDI